MNFCDNISSKLYTPDWDSIDKRPIPNKVPVQMEQYLLLCREDFCKWEIG